MIADGAASNARLFDMLTPKKTRGREFAFMGANPFIAETPLYAIYDPSHLINMPPPLLS